MGSRLFNQPTVLHLISFFYSMKILLRSMCFCLVWACACLLAQKERPNILLILSDDQIIYMVMVMVQS